LYAAPATTNNYARPLPATPTATAKKIKISAEEPQQSQQAEQPNKTRMCIFSCRRKFFIKDGGAGS